LSARGIKLSQAGSSRPPRTASQCAATILRTGDLIERSNSVDICPAHSLTAKGPTNRRGLALDFYDRRRGLGLRDLHELARRFNTRLQGRGTRLGDGDECLIDL